MPNESDNRNELLTINEVAEKLRVDPTTVRRWVKTGAMNAVSLPHRGLRQAYRVHKATLDTILASSVSVA